MFYIYLKHLLHREMRRQKLPLRLQKKLDTPRRLCFILLPQQMKEHKQLQADRSSLAPFEHNKHKTARDSLFVLVRQ